MLSTNHESSPFELIEQPREKETSQDAADGCSEVEW